MAERSLAVMPHNVAAISEMAAVMLTIHRFRDALQDVDTLLTYDPDQCGLPRAAGESQMELGECARAAATLAHIPAADRSSAQDETVRSRYEELTGKLEDARASHADATMQVDSHIDEPAQSRAWYHVRSGELDFNAGDITAAVQDERDALEIFPTARCQEPAFAGGKASGGRSDAAEVLDLSLIDDDGEEQDRTDNNAE